MLVLCGSPQDDMWYIVKGSQPAGWKKEPGTGDVDELDIFTKAVYHGKFVRFDVDHRKDTYTSPKAAADQRWQDAKRKARLMLEQCTTQSVDTKMAKLMHRTKDAKVPIVFHARDLDDWS